jgi:serine/threonine protein kinase
MFVCPECGRAQPGPGYCTEDGAAFAEATGDPLLGANIGSYRIATRIGAGGMGLVYKGVHPSIGSRVAVKVLSADCTSRPDLVERFFAEARAVNVIRHEHIVNVLDLAALPDGRPYIVMEYLDGTPLSLVIRQRSPLPLGALTRTLMEVLGALGAAHAQGIVHRDLKPDNVFVTPGGHAKVLDFGIAKLRPDLTEAEGSTRTGSLLGTPLYMSPEQAAGQPVDARSDLYSAGVILFEGSTGRPPFQSAALFQLLRQHIEQAPPLPRSLRAELPPALEQVILRALEKDPARRFQSAAEFSDALAMAASSLAPDSFTSLGSNTWGARPVSAAPGATPVSASGMSSVGSPSTAQSQSEGDTTATRPQSGRSVLPYFALGTLGLLVVGAVAAVIAVGVTLVVIWQRDSDDVLTDPIRAAETAGTESHPATPEAAPPQAGTALPDPHEPSRPPEFDPRRFDPWKFFPRAQQMAKAAWPDVELVRIDLQGINGQGLIDFTVSAGDFPSSAYYRFRSPSASKPPAGKPLNAKPEGPCLYYVVAEANGIRSFKSDYSCKEATIAPPRCSPRHVWKQAQSRGAPTGNYIGQVSYYSVFGKKPRWLVAIGSDSSRAVWVEDDC